MRVGIPIARGDPKDIGGCPNMMIWKAGPDAKCHYFNEEWLSFTGRPLEEALGDGWVENIHPDDLALCRRLYSENFRRRTPCQMRYRLRRHDRVFRLVSDHATPLFDGERFLGYFGACVEVPTEVEEGVQRAELASNVAHELRQPLSTLLLLVERMRRSIVAGGAPPAGQWNQLRRQIDRCSWLVEELSDISLLEQGQGLLLQQEVLQLEPLLSELVSVFNERELGRAEGQRHFFALEMRGPVLLRGDARRLERVFINLLENARKYSPDGGAICMQVVNEGTAVEVSVSDRGVGMSRDTLLHLTERYFRSDETRGVPGSGLGLAITRVLVEAHGGELRFESTPGEGTTVTVRLPIEGARPPQPKSSEMGPRPSSNVPNF